jgi:hypothetical protein
MHRPETKIYKRVAIILCNKPSPQKPMHRINLRMLGNHFLPTASTRWHSKSTAFPANVAEATLVKQTDL